MPLTPWPALTLAALLAGVLPSAAEPLLDYRDPAFNAGNPFHTEPERRAVAAALQKAPGDVATRFSDTFVLRGAASGAFTAPGARERVYLVQEKAAVALEPFPDTGAPVLVVLGGEGASSVHVLAGDVQYQRLVAAADTNGDGRDEAFLEASAMNMGQIVMSLDVASIREDGRAEIGEILREVYVDGCENPPGARERKAALISITDGGLRTERFTEPCP